MKDKSRSTYNQKDKIRPILHLRINNLLDIRSPKSYAKAFLLQHTYEYKEVFFPFFCSYVFPTMQKIGEELVCVLDQLKWVNQ